ncbi:odorant receptor 94a-like [Bactrocera dorsalis]|uniref:Odorant receptor n=1 Tax=Bactrocera dorsalis TaxID=27457 RepID=A0ABM3JFL5_BACDO|nr:odorant receptor 94a-like [Bactrocera dorsalis]
MFCDKIANARFEIKVLTVLGLWSPAHNNLTYFGRYYRYYQVILNITLTFIFTLLLWMEIIYSADIDYVFQWMRLAITETCLIVKVLNMWYHSQAANELVQEWDKSDMFALKTIEEEKMWQGAQRSFRKIVLVYSLLSICSVFMALFSVFFMETLALPIPYWMPASWRGSNAWPLFLYEDVVVPFSCLCNTQIELFLCYLMFHFTLCLRMIGMRMERLGDQENDEEITTELGNIIKIHQRVECMAKSCQKIITWPVLAQIVFSSLIICCSIYSIQRISFSENPSNFLGFIQYVTAMALEIFLPCYYANEIIVESENLSNHLYNCDWTGMSLYNRRQIFLYMEHLKHPIALYAGGYFQIGLPVFSKTMNNAYSLLALLANVNEEE